MSERDEQSDHNLQEGARREKSLVNDYKTKQPGRILRRLGPDEEGLDDLSRPQGSTPSFLYLSTRTAEDFTTLLVERVSLPVPMPPVRPSNIHQNIEASVGSFEEATARRMGFTDDPLFLHPSK